ncbi:Hypothetical protein FKW44_012227, partial [Caligus rogercresseyi]
SPTLFPQGHPWGKESSAGIPNIMTSTLHDLNSPINQSNIPHSCYESPPRKYSIKCPRA